MLLMIKPKEGLPTKTCLLHNGKNKRALCGGDDGCSSYYGTAHCSVIRYYGDDDNNDDVMGKLCV